MAEEVKVSKVEKKKEGFLKRARESSCLTS